MEDPILLTVNTLLLQIFTLFSYMNDGFAYAAEALTGRFIGARDEQSLRRCLGRCLGWGTLISMLFVGIYLIWWRDLLGIFIKAGTPDAAQVVSTAGNYIVWIILIPLASAMPFIMDGIMVGATETRVMRDSMFWATAAEMPETCASREGEAVFRSTPTLFTQSSTTPSSVSFSRFWGMSCWY